MTLLVATCLAACGGAAPPRDLDVVLIVVDTLRADHLGCYGHERATSPTIDALAARGVRFTRATAQSSWTAPSMVSLMLSRHLAADFVRMPAGRTLAERLSAEVLSLPIFPGLERDEQDVVIAAVRAAVRA